MFYLSFTDRTTQEVLEKLTSTIEDGPGNLVNVIRDRALESATNAFSRKSFKPERKLFCKFFDELGIDDGGPSREFMRLLSTALMESSIFEGPQHDKMLTLNYKGN